MSGIAPLVGLTVGLAACSLDFPEKVPKEQVDGGTSGDGGSMGEGGLTPCSERKELCNELDDDCDGQVDEEVVVPWYADEDGDGLGAGASVSRTGCPSEGWSVRDDDCDDANSKVGQDFPELCDGLDNDCDGRIDQTFACVLGEPGLACMTSCGSAGVGPCSDECSAPAASACIPPTETCNFKDDDCDGVADEGLLSRIAPDGIWTEPSASGKNYNLVSLAPRTDGGAWFFYMPSANPSFDARTVGTVSVAELARDGSLVGAVPSAQAKMVDATAFVAGGNQEVTAVVSRTYASNGQSQIRLQLFNAATLAFISETGMDYTLPRQTSTGGGTDAFPIDVAVHTKDGHTYVAAVYVYVTTTQGISKPNSVTKVGVAHMSPTGIWDGPVARDTLLADGLLGNNVQIEAVPCLDEFLVAFATPSQRGLRRVDLQAKLTTADPIPDAHGIIALAARPTRCVASEPPELMAVHIGADNKSSFTRLRLDAKGDYTSNGDIKAATGFLSGSAAFVGGRWLVSGYEYLGGDQVNTAPWLWEVNFDGAADEQVRDIPALSALSGAPLPGQQPGYLIVQMRTAIQDTGGSVVAAFPNSVPPEGGSQLNAARPVGVNDPAVAATYRLGCP